MRKPMLFSAAVSLVLFAEKALCYETIFSIATETFNSFRYEEMREQKAVPLSIRTGRFLSVDPKRSSARRAMPQTWNRYSYVLNNPLKYIDEKGEDITLVVRPPGDATTNFGHVAVRVYGKGYDRTYDFGRYRGTWGFMKSKGEGILRVWSNYKAFMADQEKKGPVQTLTWQTSAKTDQAVEGVFNGKIAEGEKIATTSNRTSYKLDDDYSLLSNNCTTITMDAIATGAAATGAPLDGFERVRDENDPEDVYTEVEKIKKDQ